MSRVHRTAHYVSRALVVVGIVALGYAVAIVIDARMYQARESKRFEQDRQARGAPVRIAFAPGDVGARRQVARIGPRQQPAERGETLRIEFLQHGQRPPLLAAIATSSTTTP